MGNLEDEIKNLVDQNIGATQINLSEGPIRSIQIPPNQKPITYTTDPLTVYPPFPKKDTPNFKYHEEQLMEEFRQYVLGTYKGHYVGEDNIQSLDMIFAAGHGEGFCIGNLLKLAARYKKKPGEEHTDLLKLMHYAMLLLHLELKGKEKLI